MFSFKNIISGKIESLVGLAIIAIALYTVLTGKSDWTQACTALVIGVGLLPLKLKKGSGEASVIVFMFSMLALVSCQPKQLASRTTKDSVVIKERLVTDTVTVKGDSVRLLVQIPCKELAGKTFKAKSKSGRSTVKMYVDTVGMAQIDCDIADYEAVIFRLLQEKEIWHKKEDVYIQEINKPFPWWVKGSLYWAAFSLFFLFVVIAFLIYKTVK